MADLSSAFRDVYNLAFQVSPIVLTGGTLGMPMPIIGYTGQIGAFLQGVATTGNIDLADFYATYLPIPGSTVINNAIATYPFANQQVAANAIIQQPKTVSMLMIAPVRDTGGYLTKMAIFTALQTALENHNQAGGTYTIATPAFLYQNCVMTAMTDVTTGETKQRQVMWQIDFVQPLISTSDANAAFSAQIAKITGGNVLTQSSPSGLTGSSPITGIPAAINNFMSTPALS
jgi:hypothetical protein